MEFFAKLDLITQIFITSAAIATPAMLAIKAYFEMRTAQIKLSDSIETRIATEVQSPKEIEDIAKASGRPRTLDKLVYAGLALSAVIGFILFGFGIASLIVFLSSVALMQSWYRLRWLISLTEAVKNLQSVVHKESEKQNKVADSTD